MEILFFALSFGIIAGFLPGPILSTGFLMILSSPRGFSVAILYPFLAAIAEILVALALLFAGKMFLNEKILAILSVLGGFFLFKTAFSIFSERKKFAFTDEKTIFTPFSLPQAFFVTLFNVPLHIFWMTVCLPKAIEAEKSLHYGGIFFIFCMVFGVCFTTLFLFFLFHKSRKILRNPFLLTLFPIIIALAFVFFAGKILISAIFVLMA